MTRQLWADAWYELKRSFPRLWYFLKHWQLHPEIQDRYVTARGEDYLRPREGAVIRTPEDRIITVPPPRPKGTVRLWDKDFNLLWTGQVGEPIHVTVDKNGTRFSGRLEAHADD